MTPRPGVSAVVLAAGLSARMGGAHKLLLDFAGEPLLRRVVRCVLAVQPQEVVVVTGHREAEIRAALDGLPLRFKHNAAYQEGQPTSVVAGVRALRAACEAAMIVLGDQPLLTPAALGRLIDLFRDLPPERSILVPASQGQPGNPVVFAARQLAAIRSGALNVGSGRLAETYPEEVALIEMADDAFTQDCDTPAEYAALRARLATCSTP